jgi:ubiquinone/menaquinone biosynthesis C-methylase UbiE
MKEELRVIELLRQLGIRPKQTVLDFGCGSGTYTITAARIVGAQGMVYALDKDGEALDELMQKATSVGLKNIERMETSGEVDIELKDESVDAVFLFDVFHSFFFPQADARRRLLEEIYRIMKPSAFVSISVWARLVDLETEEEVRNADFYLVKEIPETLTYLNRYIATRTILNFRKARYTTAFVNQYRRSQYEQGIRSN